jgi:hypothetical protein
MRSHSRHGRVPAVARQSISPVGEWHPPGWRLRLPLGDLGLRLQPGKPQRPYIVANDSHRHARGDDTSVSSPLWTPDGHPHACGDDTLAPPLDGQGRTDPASCGGCHGFASVPPNRRRAVRADTGRVRWGLLGTVARRACHRGARPAAGRHQVRGRGGRRAGRAPAKAERLRRIGLGWRLGTRRGGMPLTRTGTTETAGALAGSGWGGGVRHPFRVPCARGAPALWDERGSKWRAVLVPSGSFRRTQGLRNADASSGAGPGQLLSTSVEALTVGAG